jgi:segregation and condensation protein B
VSPYGPSPWKERRDAADRRDLSEGAVRKKEGREIPDPLEPAVGAVIFASDEPVLPTEIASALGGVDLAQIEEAIDWVESHLEHSGLGLQLERVAGGVRIATRPEVGTWVRRFFQERNKTRLSLPALETLAIVAYRQPMTSPEIQAIRGKDPSAALKGLLDKKLIRCLGRKKVVGSPLLYGTTKQFLLHFGLDSLDDLPSIEDFDQFLDVLQAQSELPLERSEPAGDGRADAATESPQAVPDDAPLG